MTTASSQPSVPLPSMPRPSAGSVDVVALILEQIAAVRSGSARQIDIPAGVHHIDARSLPRRQCDVSNNDSGVRPVLFDLTGLAGVAVVGHGAELIFRGEAIPFFIENCRDATVSDLTIDWERPFLSQGVVRGVDEGAIELAFETEYPFEVRDEKLVFTGENYQSTGLVNLLAFDADRRETAFRAPDHYGLAKRLRAERTGSRDSVRLHGPFTTLPEPGRVMVLKHHGRTSPAVCVSGCHGVSLRDVTVHHAGGMAFVAQASRDVSLKRCRVCPRPDSDRVFSSHADATHFVDCHGRIELIDCFFANQMDDATNIHGIFRRIVSHPASDRIEARVMHDQQDGVDTFGVGDTLAFYDDRTFAQIGQAEIVETTRADRRNSVYRLSHGVDLPAGHAVAMRWDHDIDVVIRGCDCRNNRARGLLISTLGKVLIEENRLHVPGSAIQFCCDANSWYESGPVEDVTVRRNVFDDCLYGVWGPALINVNPQVAPEYRGLPINRNIRITDNVIRTSDPRLLSAQGVEGLTFRGNTVCTTDTYPHDHTGPAVSLGEGVGGFDSDLGESATVDRVSSY